MLNFILDFFYPPVCGICEKIDKNFLCSKCNLKLNKIMKSNIIKFDDKYFEELIYLFKYDGIIRERILDYKFNEKSYIYKTISKIIVKNEKICRLIQKYDIIIPVPMHIKKLKKRGYNQTELIATEIAKRCNIELNRTALIKCNNKIAQSLLNKTQRKQNAIGAYSVIENQNIIGKNILLFDDIYTTGSTANECSKILKLAGAKSIGILVIAKD